MNNMIEEEKVAQFDQQSALALETSTNNNQSNLDHHYQSM